MDSYLYLVYPWLLPLLFVVSGISSKLYLEKHSLLEYRKSRTQKLLIPSTAGIIFHLSTGYYNYQILDAESVIKMLFPAMYMYVPKLLVYVFAGMGHLWFIQLLYLFSMLLLVLLKAEKGRLVKFINNHRINIFILLLLIIPYYFSMQILNTPYAIVYRFGQYGFMFFVGYFVFSDEKITETFKNNCLWLLLIGITLEIFYTIRTFGYNPMVKPYENNILACLCSWTMVLGLLGFSKKYLDFSNRFFSFLRKESWGLYIFHLIPLTITAYYLHRSMVATNPFICYSVTLTSTVIFSLLLNRIIIKIPLIRFLVLGVNHH